MFCFHVEISQTMDLHVGQTTDLHVALLISSEPKPQIFTLFACYLWKALDERGPTQTTNLHIVCLLSLESSWWVGSNPNHKSSHCLLAIFGKLLMSRGVVTWWFATLWSYGVEAINWLLNHFLNENYMNLKLKTLWNFGGHSWCCWKALCESDLIEFVSQFSELRCGRYWFLNGFCCWKFKQIAKLNGFGRKNQLSPQCVHLAKFRNFQSWKCENSRLCSHLGPAAQATLIRLKWVYFEDCIVQLDLRDCQKNN